MSAVTCNPSHSFCLYIWCHLPTESGPSWRPPPTRCSGATAPPPAYSLSPPLSIVSADTNGQPKIWPRVFGPIYIFSNGNKITLFLHIPDNQGYISVEPTTHLHIIQDINGDTTQRHSSAHRKPLCSNKLANNTYF